MTAEFPNLADVIDLALAIAIDQMADMFDVIFPGSGVGFRESLVSAMTSGCEAQAYLICGAATEFDYYEGISA